MNLKKNRWLHWGLFSLAISFSGCGGNVSDEPATGDTGEEVEGMPELSEEEEAGEPEVP